MKTIDELQARVEALSTALMPLIKDWEEEYAHFTFCQMCKAQGKVFWRHHGPFPHKEHCPVRILEENGL